MNSFLCLATYDPKVNGNVPGAFETLLDSFGISAADRWPVVVGYRGKKQMQLKGLAQIHDEDMMTLEVGQCAAQNHQKIASFGLSYIQNPELNSSMLFICRANASSVSTREAYFQLIDTFAESGLLGYSIGFERETEEEGSYHAAAITHGVPSNTQEQALADEYGRFFFERIRRPASSRKFNLGLFRSFEEINLLNQRQFDQLAAKTSTKFIIEALLKKSFSTGMHLLVASKGQLPVINAILKAEELLI